MVVPTIKLRLISTPFLCGLQESASGWIRGGVLIKEAIRLPMHVREPPSMSLISFSLSVRSKEEHMATPVPR